jgi:hypothetical protein
MSSIEITKSRILELIEQSDDEVLLKEVYRILEMQKSNSFQLTDKEMEELDASEKRFDEGKYASATWKEIKNRLLNKIKG